MTSKLHYYLALQLTPGIGNTNAKHVISYMGDPEHIFDASVRELKRIPGIRSKTIDSIINKESFRQADTIMEKCKELDIEILHYTSDRYPKRLKMIQDAPPILYYQGSGQLNPTNCISIVGTRQATSYGRKVVDSIVKGLVQYNPTVVSGLAYGIDIEAHRKCLEYGLPTMAVLAGGLDKIYPRNHMSTVRNMMDDGGIISEYPPGRIPEAPLFPARNRIIAGIGDATVVVEAAERGGALITANIADSYNKPVFSVPGNLDQKFSIGCNRLIRSQKAVAYTEINDLIYYLDWTKKEQVETTEKPDFSHLEGDQQKVAYILIDAPKGMEIDELSWKSQIQINHLATVLLSMEFDGIVKCLPGKKYQLKL